MSSLMYFLQVVARQTLQSNQKVAQNHRTSELYRTLEVVFSRNSQLVLHRCFVPHLKLFAEFYHKHVHLARDNNICFSSDPPWLRPPKCDPFFPQGSLCTALQAVPCTTLGGRFTHSGYNTLQKCAVHNLYTHG